MARRDDLLLPAGFQLERARALLADPGDSPSTTSRSSLHFRHPRAMRLCAREQRRSSGSARRLYTEQHERELVQARELAEARGQIVKAQRKTTTAYSDWRRLPPYVSRFLQLFMAIFAETLRDRASRSDAGRSRGKRREAANSARKSKSYQYSKNTSWSAKLTLISIFTLNSNAIANELALKTPGLAPWSRSKQLTAIAISGDFAE